jgi:hypothetical protein
VIDERRRHAMITSFIDTNGEDAAMALADSLFSIDHATKADLRPLATKADLAAYATRADLAAHATRADLEAALAKYATKADLEAAVAKCATKDDLKAGLANCATKADLQSALRAQGRWYLAITGVMITVATTVLRLSG